MEVQLFYMNPYQLLDSIIKFEFSEIKSEKLNFMHFK